MRILTINCGSSSIKADIIELSDAADCSRVAAISAAGLPDKPQGRLRTKAGDAAVDIVAGAPYAATLGALLDCLEERGFLNRVDAAGHRVVHGGPYLTDPAIIDQGVLRRIEAATRLAPLHNGPALEAIGVCAARLPAGTPMVATFDTGFFAGLPVEAATYAIPAAIARKLSIRRYGFHGLAHRFMSQRIDALSGRRDLRVVTLQLGAGCSAAAIRAGAAIDTSMGFTPLEGLVMSTRSGDIDPSLPAYIAGATGMSGDEVERILNEESGLLGLSGTSGDVRELLKAEALGESAAALALDVFCYRIRRYVGAYAAALGGLDAIGFGGGIGENSPEIRDRVCRGFEWLGLSIDPAANQRCRGLEGLISNHDSRVACHVIAVDEAQVIAADTLRCLSESRRGRVNHGRQ